MLKRCPVCGNIGKAWGKKTCGAPECIREWKSWNSSTRIKATFRADYPGEEFEGNNTPIEIAEELKTLLKTQPTQRENDLLTANEALKSIFGDKNQKE